MAIQTYSDLISAVDSETTFAGAPIENCIVLAEEALRPMLKHYRMEKKVTLTVPANTSPELPADLQELRAILVNGELIRPLSFQNRQPTAMGFIITGSKIDIRPAPATDYQVELDYYERLPALSNDNPTNWLLTYFPTVYLRAASAQVYHWLKDKKSEDSERELTGLALSAVSEDHKRVTMYGNTIIEELSSW